MLAGGRSRLVVDEHVRLEPFEGITFPEPARVHLDLHAAGDMLEVLGAVDVGIRGECGRCLGEVRRELHVDVDEQLDVGAEAQGDPFGPSNVLTGDRLDVRDLAMQLVVSSIPMGLLCSEECLGICAACGENKNDGACTCRNETTGDE